MNFTEVVMYHLYSILVKPKYNINFVLKLNESCKTFLNVPFIHYCLTDQPEQFIDTNIIPIDVRPYNLEGWWYKLLLFKPGICKPKTECIFFDLDSKLLKPIDKMLKFNDKLIVGQNPSKITHKSLVNNHLRRKSLGMHFTILNSSIMMWTGGNHHDLYEKFMTNYEEYMIQYFGNDEFITFEYPEGYDLLDTKWIFNSTSLIDSVFSLKMSDDEFIKLMI
jgi:hypothetical protein